MDVRGRTYRVFPLGCKVSRYDLESIREQLDRAGAHFAQNNESPDLCVVSSCVVTAEAEKKSRRKLRRLRKSYPKAKLVLIGCLPELISDGVSENRSPDADFIVPNSRLPGILAMLRDGGSVPDESSTALSVSSFKTRTRAFLKVQDGCDHRCSYCILPKVRGRPCSRPTEEVLAEARRLVTSGHREIVICGVRLGLYGRDLSPAVSLTELCKRILSGTKHTRLRLSSIEPWEVDEELIFLMRDEPRLCPHFHLPLQSGDAGVLNAMRRPYSPDDFLRLTERIRSAVEMPALTTDIIVGFPGESESAFRHTMQMCERVGFSRVHVFPFSPRPGTAAETLPGRCPAVELASRKARALEAARGLSSAFAARQVGRRAEVLVESAPDRRTGRAIGYTERYVRTLLDIEPDETTAGKLVNVEISAAHGARCEGTIQAVPD